MASPSVNCDPFYLVVIYYIGDKGGKVDMSLLGLDPNIKQQFAGLNLAKKHKMGNVLDMRPDLFKRDIGDKGGASIKLTEAAMTVLQTNELPAADPSLNLKKPTSSAWATRVGTATAGSNNVRATGIEMPALPANVNDATQARKYFITTVVRVLGTTPALGLNCSELGCIHEIKEAWTAGTLHKNYKM